jgi:hypothetical protein
MNINPRLFRYMFDNPPGGDKLDELKPIIEKEKDVQWLNDWFMFRFKTTIDKGKAKIGCEIGWFWTVIKIILIQRIIINL